MGNYSYSTHKLAMVETNDSLSGSVSLSLDAKGWLPSDTSIKLDLNPRIVDFGPLGKKRKTQVEAVIKNLSSEEMALTIVDSPPDFFKEMRLSKDIIKPGETAKLKVKLKRESEDQRFQKSITLTAKGKNINYRFAFPIQKGFASDESVKKACGH